MGTVTHYDCYGCYRFSMVTTGLTAFYGLKSGFADRLLRQKRVIDSDIELRAEDVPGRPGPFKR